MNDQSLFEQLQQILLQEDRAFTQKIESQVSEIKEDVSDLKEEVSEIREDVSGLKENLDDHDKFVARVNPLIDLKIAELKRNFGDTFGYEIKETVKIELNDSKDEFIEALYPIIGKIARKYVMSQFESFLEGVSSRMESAFSPRRWKERVTGLFAGVGQDELAIKAAFSTSIEEVFVIHSESGLLIACYSTNNMADVDMIAGMFNAIKAFVGDTFNRDNPDENLRFIQHGDYKILINDFYKYYIATVVSGNADNAFRNKLDAFLLNFCEKEMPNAIKEIDDQLFDQVSKKLKNRFESFDVE